MVIVGMSLGGKWIKQLEKVHMYQGPHLYMYVAMVNADLFNSNPDYVIKERMVLCDNRDCW